MKTILTLLAVTNLFFSFAQTTISDSIFHNGGFRTYLLYVPSSYTNANPTPLVLNLHGYGSNSQEQIVYGDFRPIADTANFLILLPQGLPMPFTGSTHWNASYGTGVEDVDFIDNLLDSIALDYNLNQDRIYSTGMSNGGFMSLTLAGELSNRITAVASVTGVMTVNQIPANTVTTPVPVMQIHGTQDGTVNYNGTAQFLSVDSVVSYWVNHNNCNSTPVVTPIANTNTTDGCTAERFDYLNGDNGAEVVHYKVTGGEHTWPGSAVNIGVTNQDFNACIEIWKFFNKYNKETLLKVEELSNNKNWLTLLSQNPTKDFLKIKTSDKENYTISIHSLDGKLVKKIENNTAHTLIDLTSFANGTYIINVRNAKNKASLKIIKN